MASEWQRTCTGIVSCCRRTRGECMHLGMSSCIPGSLVALARNPHTQTSVISTWSSISHHSSLEFGCWSCALSPSTSNDIIQLVGNTKTWYAVLSIIVILISFYLIEFQARYPSFWDHVVNLPCYWIFGEGWKIRQRFELLVVDWVPCLAPFGPLNMRIKAGLLTIWIWFTSLPSCSML